MNFIEEYLRLTEDLESPTSYLKWGAISCISAALRDNVFFKFPNRLETVYPNTYVLLLGDTAKVRKSNPLNITGNLLRELNNTKVMAGAASMQGVLRELANTENNKPKGGSGIMIAKELDAFFVKDPSTIGILTDLYDFHPLYEKFLASQDTPPVKNVCLSLLAGSNEVMMRDLMNQTATEGGLLGRFMVIYESNKRKSNSGFEDNQQIIKDEDWNQCRAFLRKLASIKGPIRFDDAARKYYNDWYHSLYDKNFNTKTGYEHRIHTHALKLSTIFAASKTGFNLEIKLEEIEQAIFECGSLIQTYQRLTLGTGRSNQAVPMSLIVCAVLESPNHHISRRDLLIKLYGEVDVESLDKSLETLTQTEYIQEASISMCVGYKATQKLLDKIFENKKAIGMVQ